jgi:class 3 adenylate cyclase/DNA-directed RNA polymerase subunit L
LTEVLRHRGALEGETKPITVLFLDVEDSMGLAGRLGAEEWHALLDRFFRVVTATIRRSGGTVNQYTGDGVMALFGAPVAQEDHARRACEAALALRDELGEFGDRLAREQQIDLRVRMGLNSGDAVVGRIGDDLRRDYTAQGRSVGLAERMQRIAHAGEIVITAHTASLVEGFFDLDSLGEVEAKGAGAPVHAHRLVGPRPTATRLERSARRGLSRFVGREREMATLEALATSVRPGRGHVVGVVGAAGVGKSRLCQEFAASCRARRWSVHETHGLAHRQHVVGLALGELARSLLAGAAEAGSSSHPAPAAGALASDGAGLRSAEPTHPEPPEPADASAAQALAHAVANRLRDAAGAAPVVLLLDDAHWIDPTSLAALEQIVATAARSAALVLINFRPGFTPPGARRSDYQQIALLPLDEDASDALVAELLGRHPSLGALPEHLRERAAGNPFFLEEMVRALVDSGALGGERGDRRLLFASIDAGALAVPTDVRALLAARIDRLTEREKHVVEAAAVIGRHFVLPVLARVAGLPGEELDASLQALERAELLRDEGGATRQYSFEHPLVQEVAYRSQLAEKRQRMHVAVARALEELFADRLGETAALVAHHWEAAGRASSARRWHRLAALRVTRVQPLRHH